MKDTGGPAFPHPLGWRRDPEISDGMTLRDYFAAKAMQGLLFARNPVITNIGGIAEAAYAMADAMLAERNNT
jgi:hypothetical protein